MNHSVNMWCLGLVIDQGYPAWLASKNALNISEFVSVNHATWILVWVPHPEGALVSRPTLTRELVKNVKLEFGFL